jgi:hypothetical protein
MYLSDRFRAAQLLLRRNKARTNFLDFITYTKKNYVVNWHHELMCRKIDDLLEGKIKLRAATPP